MPKKFRTFLKRYVFLAAASAVLLVLSFYGWQYAEKNVHERSQLQFEEECQRIEGLIQNRLELYVNALYGAQALFASSRSVERDEWQVYVESQHLEERYPGIAAIRYVERVQDSDKGTFIETVKKDVSLDPLGYPDFLIHPLANKTEYFVVKYVEPYRGNETMLGLDSGYEPARLAALEGARDSGEPRATAKITLADERRSGFLVVLPVYRNGAPISTSKERKAALMGYVDAVFRAEDFFSAIFKRNKFPPYIDCEVFDGDSLMKENLLHDFDSTWLAAISGNRSSFHKEMTLKIADQQWRLYFSALPDFGLDVVEKKLPLFILFGGLLSGVFMFLLGASRAKSMSLKEGNDVLEAKVTERTHELAEANTRYRLVELATNDAVWDWNLLTDKLHWNDAVQTLFGYGKEDVTDEISWWTDNLHSDDKERVLLGVHAVIGSGGQNWSGEYRFRCKNGSYANVIDRGYIIHDNQKRPVRMVGAMLNITERKKLEAMMLQSEKMAAVGQMAAGLTHEINNPLSVILGFSQTLLKQIQPGDALEMPLKSIETEAIRCRQLVQDVLGFSRTQKAEMQEINLNEAIESAISLVIAQAKTKQVMFAKELQTELPKVVANRNQILQVIINLSNNAIDAMPQGGQLTIRTLAIKKEGKDELEIQVEDNGQGIPQENLSTIFEPFFTTKEIGKGTGLGLSLVYDIVVNKHHGRLDVKSEIGKGTTFCVGLPIH